MGASSANRAVCNVKWILGDVLAPNERSESPRPAVVWEHGSRTYQQLRDRALRVARWLQEQGLSEGDRVAGYMYNRGEIFDIYFACAFAGLTYVPINFRLHESEVAKVLRDCRPGIVFVDAELGGTLHTAIMAADLAGCRAVELGEERPGDEYDRISTETSRIEQTRHTDIQLILYTSGSTGSPKGVMLTHDNVMRFAAQQALCFTDFDERSITMLTGPMYNQAAINEQSIPTLLVGGTVAILPSRGWSAERMIDHVDRWAVTHTIIYPSMIKAVLRSHAERPDSLSSLRFVLTGGENVPPSLVRSFLSALPNVHLLAAYGSSESGFLTTVSNSEIIEHEGSVGRSLPDQTFYIGDRSGRPLPVGEIGEIWTLGPGVSPGYWEAPELTTDAFRDGWHRMGDLGRVDEQGRLFLSGRSKDMIISKGQNIYPAEIENALLLHSVIAEVAVVGLPDEEFGEIVCAAVVLESGAAVSEDELIDFARQHIASYKKPRRVVFLERLPRNPSAKVLKDEVKEMLITGRTR